ncbi:MAG: hypothetical protein JO219_09050 [Candidatus Eremiobacteraeota bacterium]|nr:hypothetical protein [Candidatus Eremiobacteraeota bacterium]MBV8366995.1 hypothetical protein [Candidatus Eremiobacteraeota bacterium]
MKRVNFLAMLWSLIAAGCMPALADESSYPATVWAHERPEALTASIESNGSNLSVGQPILVKITLANNSDVGIQENVVNAWYMFSLRVLDARGAVAAPNVAPVHKVASSYLGRPGALWPGQTFVVPGETQDQFTNLEAWGYRLNQPGTYRIMAFQKLGNGAEVDSNTITIILH